MVVFNFRNNMFRSGLLLLTTMWCLASCSMKKATKVEFTNKNAYAVDFKVQANNVEFVMANVAAGEKVEGLMDWTKIEKKDGQWIFWVTNTATGMKDSFVHGFFVQGSLVNFLQAEASGSQLKVNLME